MLKGRSVPKCSNSELDNMYIIHGAQDNSWIADNFQSIVLCVTVSNLSVVNT